jgi:hypothetical protein
MGHHGFDGEHRIGTVSDIVTEERVAVDPAAAGMIEARREGFPVGVEISEKSKRSAWVICRRTTTFP